VRAAEQAGADLWWQSPVEAVENGSVTAGGRSVRCRWIAGADGGHSRVREWCGLQPVWNTGRRIGLRQHFRVEPWTDFVEVYWSQNCQAYVTPVGPDEVCVALLGTEKEVGVEELPSIFPKLAAHLAEATRSGPARGGMSMSMRLAAVTKGNVALLGDASGTVDAITGEGLHLAFRQAAALADALAIDDLSPYAAAHRRLQRMPQLMARLLLLLDGNERLRRAAFRALATIPSLFNGMLAFHVGGRPPSNLSLGLLDRALQVLSPARVLGPRG
jgi:flavin-dependent dehydrogenase